MTIHLSNSSDPNAKAALTRLNQLKQQLNLTPSNASKQTVLDMTRERNAAEFNIEALAKLWAGSEKAYRDRQNAYNFIKNDPELVVQPPRNFLELDRAEFREFTMGQIYRLAQLAKEINSEQMYEIGRAVGIYSESFSMRFGVHGLLFKNVINMLSNDEQRNYWMPLVNEMKIIGCFAMTELGHSSALRGLETTATFDVNTDEFIINSPTITSTKYWIGMAGQSATHTVVIAQTIVHGENKGLNWFVVQLRNVNTGELMPNVIAGDIGSKVGHQGLDNGFIQFKQLRIPRSHLLAKWVRLDRDGTFHQAPNPAMMYATLIPERLSLVGGMIILTTQALTIASRYGVTRRQGPKNQQIMDYQSHYGHLLPAISFMYMVQTSFETLDEQFSVLTGGGSIKDEIVYLNHMGELHAISASMKGLVGWYCSDILETCRRCCGGHAYSAYNAIGHIIQDYGVFTTGGGDNVVLLQQTAKILRYRLMQQLENDSYPEFKFKSSSHYIVHAKHYMGQDKWHVESDHLDDCLKDFSLMTDALYSVTVKKLHRIEKAIQQGATENELLLENVKVAELHCAAFLLEDNAIRFGRTKPHTLEPTVAKIMHRLTGLWGLYVLHTYSDQGFKEGFFTPDQVNAIETLYLKTCHDLRYQIIGLTDAWGYPDFVLKAPIGKYNGDIYEAYLDTVLQAPNSISVPSYHTKYIKPLTERAFK
ncbi:uncharacterized protein BX664DRAFT_273493 [Halteromyces radiatus]|uniref:uncharacterized protein n=1 Tax=Halteromyces radiatus TaxID=101107 RepID=UPI00221F85FB|nr:uncharacterized protein BX664DRAFT_273493 [Halteromyces radiatus]KAI8099931.1 hypothetical protein BX664DRAFT_273493 [Halteromyces radiatus]